MWERIRKMLSRISRRRRWGSLEDMDLVSKSIGSDVGFEFIASRDVDPLRNQFLDLGDYSCVVEQVHASLRVEVEEQIEVAVRALGAARPRTEKREMFDAKLLEAWRGRAEDIENVRNFLRVDGDGRDALIADDGAAWKHGDAGRLERRSDGCETCRNRSARGALEMSDGEPGDAGPLGQLSLSDTQEGTTGPAHFRSQ